MLQEIGQRQQQLLKLLLRQKQGMTLNDIADRLEISRTAVQQHVASLGARGFVAKGEIKKTSGRPVQSYVLTNKGVNVFPKRYAWFTELLLVELKRQLGKDGLVSLLRSLAENIAKDLQPRFDGKSTQERVAEMEILLEELGYQTLFNASSDISSDDGLEIRACNCVYHSVAQEHNEVCQFDIALVKALVGREVDHAACMARGDAICKFRLIGT